jgi:hypothetical protein
VKQHTKFHFEKIKIPFLVNYRTYFSYKFTIIHRRQLMVILKIQLHKHVRTSMYKSIFVLQKSYYVGRNLCSSGFKYKEQAFN